MSWPVNYPLPTDYALLSIRNVGAQTLYLGGTNVTPSAGLPCAPGTVVQLPLYATTLTGMTLSITTDGQLTLPKPKTTVDQQIAQAKVDLRELDKSHARDLAMNLLDQAALWAKEAAK